MKALKTILFLSLFKGGLCFAENSVLLVDANFIKVTETPSMHVCMDENEKNCWAFKHFYLYRAKIKQKFTKNIQGNTISFANSQHAPYIESRLKKWVLIVREIKGTELGGELAADYLVLTSAFNESGKYCFSKKIESYLQNESVANEAEESEFCYTKSELKKAL